MTYDRPDDYVLCGNCWRIHHAEEILMGKEDEDGDIVHVLVIHGEEPSIAVCPYCKFLHRMGDDGPGIYTGTYYDMSKERFDNLDRLRRGES